MSNNLSPLHHVELSFECGVMILSVTRINFGT